LNNSHAPTGTFSTEIRHFFGVGGSEKKKREREKKREEEKREKKKRGKE
jgi:hypothetical protein